MNLSEILNWRYAAKRMSNKEVPQSQIDEILEAIRLSPSSAGMQPYKVMVVKNPDLKKRLQAASFNPQVSESSHLLVFATYESIKQSHIDDYLQLMAETRDVSMESLNGLRGMLEGHFPTMSEEDSLMWASRQAYIGLGIGLVASANLGVDSTPMEGFNGQEFDEILGLKEKGLKSVVLLALGYRDEENDYLAKAKKVRIAKEDFVITYD